MICHSNHRVLNTSQHATPVRTNEKAANTSEYRRHLRAQIFLDAINLLLLWVITVGSIQFLAMLNILQSGALGPAGGFVWVDEA